MKWAIVASALIVVAALVLSVQALGGDNAGEDGLEPLAVIVLWALAALAIGVVILIAFLSGAIKGVFMSGRSDKEGQERS